MTVPHECAWAELSGDGKRARLLAAAREVFARDGLAAPMPAIAAAAGAGVGSVYRQFPAKDDIVAALVLERLGEFVAALDDAVPTDDPWADVEAIVRIGLALRDGGDDVLTEAIAATGEREDVQAARARSGAAMTTVLDRARAAGVLRADATADDLRLLFAAVRGGDAYTPDGGSRVATLILAGLRAR